MSNARIIHLAFSRDPDEPAIQKVDKSDLMEINYLADDLGKYGIDVHIEEVVGDRGATFAYLVFKYDTYKLEIKRTRRAGRRAKDLPHDSPLYGLTAAQAAEWLDDHTVADGMDALGGVSRAVYYRRKKYLNQLRDTEPDHRLWSINWQY